MRKIQPPNLNKIQNMRAAKREHRRCNMAQSEEVDEEMMLKGIMN